MATYQDSIVAVGRLLRPKAGEPRVCETFRVWHDYAPHPTNPDLETSSGRCRTVDLSDRQP
jgi:hypothetical protein